MVHRSGSTLIIATNDSDHSKNLPQFLDGLDPCAVPTVKKNEKSTLPNTEKTAIPTTRALRTVAQNKQLTKFFTTRKTRDRQVNSGAEEKNETNSLLPSRIRSGLRSNSVESNAFPEPNDDNVSSNLVSPRRRNRKMKKKRKGIELKKSRSEEDVFGANGSEDIIGNIPLKLTCSLPLDRLSGILDSILSTHSHLCESKFTHDSISPTDGELPSIDNVGTESLGHSSQLNKLLCLYCDKKFSSQKVLIKHTDRIHAITKGRRLSSRNSTTFSPNIASFSGCSFCCFNSNKLKTITVSEDLKSLFNHLIDFHSDKYFGCKTCAIRFLNAEELENHLEDKHKPSNGNKSRNTGRKGKPWANDCNLTFDSLKSSQVLQQDVCSSDKASSIGDDTSNDPENTPTKTRRQLKQAMENKPLTTRSCQSLLRSDEAILSRLGVAQNRLPRGRKGVRNRRICNLEVKNDLSLTAVKTRNKVGRVITSNIMDPIEPTSRPPTNSRIEVLSCTFDEDFYETVSINVRKNLSCHLDGKLEGNPTSPSPLSPVATIPAIRSTVVKSPLNNDTEIHEATTLSTDTAFPTLLTADQYGSDLGCATKIKRPITKHSWKWKWDCVKKYKYVNEGGKIVKKVKQPIAGLRDLSKLDMWTQLTMRTKHEIVHRQRNELSGLNEVLGIGETVREEKRKQIAQLNTMLDTRRLPQIILEQSEQTIIKLEIPDDSNLKDSSPISTITSSKQLKFGNILGLEGKTYNRDIPTMLNLTRRCAEASGSQEDLILSGEWARPRCYICFGCGAKFDKLKSLEEHKMFRHPYVYSTHYEIVGRELIEGDLYKHFYIPTKALCRHKEYKLHMAKKLEGDGKSGFSENSTCGEESMDSVNSVPASYSTGTSRSDCDTENKTVFASSSSVTTSLEIEEESILKFHGRCTKCSRECGGLLELYRHMLDCSGDYAWILAKKKKYRYFGVKRKRHARQNLPLARRKIIKHSNVKSENSEERSTQKAKAYPSTPRPKPSDAESIRRMLENLPAKRACRQIIPNITKPRVRKIPQSMKKGIIVKNKNAKKSKGNMASTTVSAISKNILRSHNKRIYTRHLRQVCSINKNPEKQPEKKKTKSGKTRATNAKFANNDDDTPTVEKSCIFVDANEDNMSKANVVQVIGKNTTRLVKKITQKLQSNKPFLNKKTTRSSNKHRATNTARIQIAEDLTLISENVDQISKEQNKETESKIMTDIKTRKVQKRTSNPLLRKLSFRQSTKNTNLKNMSHSECHDLDIANPCEINEGQDQETLNNKAKKIDNISTKSTPAQFETKISRTRAFKKILNKLKEKANKKVEKHVETESQTDTAVTVQVQNLTNDDLAEEKKTKSDSKEIVIDKVEDKIRTEQPLNNSLSSLNVEVLPANLLVVPQTMHQVSPSTKKRSKKLNDCIAMLTGKLQEKLGKPFFESNENLDSALSRQSSTTDITIFQDTSTPVDLTISAAVNSNNKISLESNLEKKPPKRKTVTRKIIKKQNCDTSVIMGRTENNLNKVCDLTQKAPLLRPPILKISSPKEEASKDFSQNHKNFESISNIENFNVDQKKTHFVEVKSASDTVNITHKSSSFAKGNRTDDASKKITDEIREISMNINDDSTSPLGKPKNKKKVVRKNMKFKAEISDAMINSEKVSRDIEEMHSLKIDNQKPDDTEQNEGLTKTDINKIPDVCPNSTIDKLENDKVLQYDISSANLLPKMYNAYSGVEYKDAKSGFPKVDVETLNSASTNAASVETPVSIKIFKSTPETNKTKPSKKGKKICYKKTLKQPKLTIEVVNNEEISKNQHYIEKTNAFRDNVQNDEVDQAKLTTSCTVKPKMLLKSLPKSIHDNIGSENCVTEEDKLYSEKLDTSKVIQDDTSKSHEKAYEIEKNNLRKNDMREIESVDDTSKLVKCKFETKKYTRKGTTKRTNPKLPTSLASLEVIKSCAINIAVDSAINLSEESQVQITTSENITLSSALPYSPTPESHTVMFDTAKTLRSKRIINKKFRNCHIKSTDKNISIKNKRQIRINAQLGKSRSKPSTLTEVEEIVASFLSNDNEDDQRTQADANSVDKPIRLDGAEAILTEDDYDDASRDTRRQNLELQISEDQSLTDSNFQIIESKLLAENVDKYLMLKYNEMEKMPVVCKELSVSLVKLPDDMVNFKTGSCGMKDLDLRLQLKTIEKEKEAGDQAIQTNEIQVDIRNSGCPEVKLLEKCDTIIHLNSTSKQNVAQYDNFLVESCNSKDDAKNNRRMSRNVSEVNQESQVHEISDQKTGHGYVQNFDEASISSNLKSRDGSEMDVRPESVAKKQRRRRKNELAAIVADQLLESFKEVDKSKIDDLKMLENLAYEKSEDLLLTGMRLTPTTKRKIIAISENKDNFNATVAMKKEMSTLKGKNKNSKGKKQRSKFQSNNKTIPTNDVDGLIYKKQNNKTDDRSESITKQQKFSENTVSAANENLFRSIFKNDEPLKLNLEPLSQKHNFKISSNFNTTQFEVFSTFKNSFDTFRSLTDFSFMTRKEIARKSNFVPGSTETSNSVDSHSLKHDDASKACDTVTGDKSKTTFTKKQKKKFNRKRERAESRNINELRTDLELFSLDKEPNQNASGKPDNVKKINDLFSGKRDLRDKKSSLIAKSQFSLSNPELYSKSSKVDKAHLVGDSKKPLLRPSILAATFEASRNSGVDAQATEAAKSISSRDPRLNKNKILAQASNSSCSNITAERLEKTSAGLINQRRKSERDVPRTETEFYLNNAVCQSRERLRSFRKEKNYKLSKENNKNAAEGNCRSEEEEDNYLSQIAKSVNEKIMSSEDEGDGFEICMTDSNLLLATDATSRPPTAMSTRSMPNFNDEQSNVDFMQEDDNTNTELIDMDLEDDMSVYTSFSQDLSRFTGKGKFGSKRRRRRSILFTRKPKKQNPNPDQDELMFTCEICNKGFRKASALSKHQMTLTHISKLSEHEYLNASKSVNQEEIEETIHFAESDHKQDNPNELINQSINSQLARDLEFDEKESEPVEELVNEGEAPAAMPVETEVPLEPTCTVREKHSSALPVVNLLNQPGIEPISSPEQVDTNYDRYQNVSSRIALSQEERLFYECCNMLKGSETPMVERTYPIVPYSAYDVPNKPVTPKSSERFSYLGSEATGNFHHGTAYTVKSPMSQSRTSPRHAYPKIDVNQFSDISSDSNPAFPRTQPHPNLQSNLNYSTPDLTNKTYSPYHHASPLREVQNVPTGISAFGQEVPNHNYPGPYFSGEGNFTPTQFPIGTEGSTASLTARTFISEEQAKDFNAGQGKIPTPSYPNEPTPERNQNAPFQIQNFTSPIHSTSSQGSTNTTCRMKTKAAMKGYDNFKVSIPTMGLDMQQALERSPHGGCKLTALAEIALGSEAPIATRYPPLQIREDICDKPKVKPDINEKFAKKYQELIKSNMKPVLPKVVKKKDVPEKMGNKLGFKAKKNKHRPAKNVEALKSPEKPKDIYEFDDSEEMEPNEVKTSIRGRSGKPMDEKIFIPERPFKDIGLGEEQGIKFYRPDEINNPNEESQMSSTSYSDRDDFNYGSMSDNEERNRGERASTDSESNSSARTTKTIENKCLIMGRIFKNATKNRPEERKSDNSLQSKKKLPTQELNKLFDSLREKVKETDAAETLNIAADLEPPIVDLTLNKSENLPEVVINKNDEHSINMKKPEQMTKENRNESKLPSRVQQTLNMSEENLETKQLVAVKERKEAKRLSRNDSERKQSKEIYRLQSELGMSAEEIANLIGEGKRKPQRRCAVNRPQKFVETWSSDEYEDFLSTQDIIAFIEEKERKSRKRKSITTNNDKKKSENSSGKSTNSTTKPDNPKDGDSSIKKSEKIVDHLLEKIGKVQSDDTPANNKDDSKPSEANKSDKEKKIPCSKANENPLLKKPTLSVKPRLKNKTDSESDFEAEMRKSRSKIKKRRKTISFKEQDTIKKQTKPATLSKNIQDKSKGNSCREKQDAHKNTATEAARPLARRKRVASEMLYYWSSSSDEEFGRIETRDDDDDITPEGEHYQQHGWIVGDSHKKLVTLLAIAKGKKVEDCGVKESSYKKKT